MKSNKHLTEEQINKIKDLKDPDISTIVELAYELKIDPLILADYFIKKESN